MALTKSFPYELTITYVTAPWARGRGIAQRAIRAAVQFGFENLGAKRIAWDAIVGNHASRLAAIRTGFTVEGIARNGVHQRGDSRDCWVGGILPGRGARPRGRRPTHYEILKKQAGFFMADREELETGVAGLRLRPIREDGPGRPRGDLRGRADAAVGVTPEELHACERRPVVRRSAASGGTGARACSSCSRTARTATAVRSS